jgi:hypothetical protein
MMDRRGQGLSLTTIIVAALALIVLVVLVMIFTGRIAIFQKGVSEEAQAELIALKVRYGDCHPTATAENDFLTELGNAASAEEEETVKQTFVSAQLNRCKALTDQLACEGAGCEWR